MKTRASVLLTGLLGLALILTGCGQPGSAGTADDGGSATGGSTGSGGSIVGTGGKAGSGGTTGAGGSSAGSGGKAGTGGTTGSGGTTGTGGGSLSPYDCNSGTAQYDATVVQSGTTWTVSHSGSVVSTTTDMMTAIFAGIDSLTTNRTAKQSVLVRGSGDISADSQRNLPSYLVLNVCGTINVTGTTTGSDRAPVYARGRHDIEIPNLTMTGAPMYGMFFRNVDNLHLGHIELRLTGGLGIRVDNNAGTVKNTNLTIDYAYGSGTGSHVVETYGIDQVKIGTIEGLNVGECGLLLNNTTNAEVDLVTCNNCGAGTGYAAFRIANNAGKIGDDWPAGNIHVRKVYARQGGRGIFSVSGSGGLTVDQLDIASTGNNAILLQNCINTTIAAQSGTVSGNSIILSNDTTNTDNGTYIPSRNVTLQNLTLGGGTSVSEAWCQLGDRGNRAKSITGGSVSMCFGD